VHALQMADRSNGNQEAKVASEEAAGRHKQSVLSSTSLEINALSAAIQLFKKHSPKDAISVIVEFNVPFSSSELQDNSPVAEVCRIIQTAPVEKREELAMHAIHKYMEAGLYAPALKVEERFGFLSYKELSDLVLALSEDYMKRGATKALEILEGRYPAITEALKEAKD
jgi:hypothetical protein